MLLTYVIYELLHVISFMSPLAFYRKLQEILVVYSVSFVFIGSVISR